MTAIEQVRRLVEVVKQQGELDYLPIPRELWSDLWNELHPLQKFSDDRVDESNLVISGMPVVPRDWK